MGEKLRFGDLKPGDFFIAFPTDGDNSGHGGYLGSSNVFLKTQQCFTMANYQIFKEEIWKQPACLDNAVSLFNRGYHSHFPDTMAVIKLS